MEILAQLVLLFLPFERFTSHNIAGATIRISTIFVLLGAILLIRQWPKIFKALSSLDWAVIIYLAVVVLSILVAPDKHRALAVLSFVFYVILGYLLISRSFRANFNYQKIEKYLLAGAAVTALFGLYQFFGDAAGLSQHWTGLGDLYTKRVFGFARIQSTGVEPLYYANYLLLPITWLSSRFLSKKESLSNSWYIALLTLLIWVFVLALSRGANIALGIGLLLTLVLFWRQTNWRRIGQLILIYAIGIVLAFTSIYIVTLHNKNGRNLSTFTGQVTVQDYATGESTNLRIARFKEAWRQFKQKPILGQGIGQFGVTYNQPDKNVQRFGYPIVNNIYLETLAELGIVGFAALVAILIITLRQLILTLKSDQSFVPRALLVTFIAVWIQYNFFSTIYILYIWVLFGLIDAYTYSRRHE